MDITTHNLKKQVTEPKIFALIVKSPHASILHLGIHFSLEEAYTSARQRMEAFTPHEKGDNIDIDLWNSLSAREVIVQLINPTHIDKTFIEKDTNSPATSQSTLGDLIKKELATQVLKTFPEQKAEQKNLSVIDQVRDIKKAKNSLLQTLIDIGDINEITRVKGAITKNEKSYILKQIEKKHPKIDTSSSTESKEKTPPQE